MPQLFLRKAPLGNIKGVLFDKDGTISSSEEYLTNLAKLRVEKSIELFKNELEVSSFHISQLIHLLSSAYGLDSEGLNPDGAIAIASREDNLISTTTVFSQLLGNWPKSLNAARKVFLEVDNFEIENGNQSRKRKLIHGARRVLKELNNSGAICCIISNDSNLGIEIFIKENNIQDNIHGIWGSDNSLVKPNPKSVIELCKRTNLKPSECALIGDADSDLLMARQAGIGLILGFTAGWGTAPSLNEYQHLIHNWDELCIQ